MTLLFDTNIVLDVIQGRRPHLKEAAWAFARVERGEDQGILCGTTLATVCYILEKTPGLSKQQVREALRQLLNTFEVASVGRSALMAALEGGFDDYEDAVLYESGRRAGAEAIITRDSAGFAKAEIPVYTPQQLRVLVGEK